MPNFSYVARTSAGRMHKGTQEAVSAADLVHVLRERGWLVFEVRAADPTDTKARDRLALLNPLTWLPTRSVDVEMALQQMAVMLRSGITLLSTLKAVAEYASNRNMRRILEEVGEKIQRGSTLADALANYPCFSHLVIQLVRVGEQTGTLEQVVVRAAEALQRRRLVRNQLLTAMFYPTVVVISAVSVAAYMVVVLIPKLQKFLRMLGRTLPPLTQRLLDVSDFVQEYGVSIAIGIVVTIVAVVMIYLWPPGRLMMDRMMLRSPLIGFLLRLSATVQFSYGLGTMLHSGVTLVEGLRTVEDLHRNRWVAGRVGETRSAVLRGASLAEPLATQGVFMPMLSRMVAVGESAGTLDDVLLEVGRFHETQLQSTIKLFSTMIEPVVTVVVGGIVGFVYIAFFLALFSVAGRPR